jgi:hypothetical protein
MTSQGSAAAAASLDKWDDIAAEDGAVDVCKIAEEEGVWDNSRPEPGVPGAPLDPDEQNDSSDDEDSQNDVDSQWSGSEAGSVVAEYM